VKIVPWLSCRNRLGAPDFMRGEETQLLGALEVDPGLRSGRHLLCLPGTHTKWVALEDGEVRDFLTAPTGELFAVLRDHSVLVHQRDSTEAGPGAAAFARGLAEFNRLPAAELIHRLFECRARRLAGDLSEADAAPYLSGLLIGSDVAGALSIFGDYLASRSVRLIGTPQLTALYLNALRNHDLVAHAVDGAAASLAGLAHIQRHLDSTVANHAN
jgi:2-dehydro-3-deoxygalactonokinase